MLAISDDRSLVIPELEITRDIGFDIEETIRDIERETGQQIWPNPLPPTREWGKESEDVPVDDQHVRVVHTYYLFSSEEEIEVFWEHREPPIEAARLSALRTEICLLMAVCQQMDIEARAPAGWPRQRKTEERVGSGRNINGQYIGY